MPSLSVRSLALALLTTLSAASVAHANGRFPSAGHIEVDPADPSHVVQRTTYGLVLTRDGGAQWKWVCEEGMGFAGIWDPPIGITAGGALLAGLPDGLAISSPDGCGFSRANALEGRLAVDLSVDRKDPARAVVLTSTPKSGAFSTQLFETKDGGKTFLLRSDALPADLQGLTVDLAPSDPATVYVSGVQSGAGVLLRSKDGGQSFDILPVPGSDGAHGPFIGAVDPNDPARVYVRLDGAPGRLLASADGGGTWETIFQGEGALLAFALSPDGSALLVGGEKDGLWRSPAPQWAFAQVSPVRARCLRWTGAGVYACAEEVLDGFSVGFSTTEGSTFKPFAHTASLCGLIDCPSSADVVQKCASRWPALRDTLGAVPCAEAGTSASSSSAASSGAGGSAGATPGAGGCGCTVAGAKANAGAAAVAVVIAVGMGARRRRRARR
jgi:MYXO-CTERM domain-containing protein